MLVALQHRLPAVRPVVMRAMPIRMDQENLQRADDFDHCYLFDSDEGRKYVCTENPEELAWYMGLDESDLVSGPKPDDLDLMTCFEDWSHNGTPEWVCSEELQSKTSGKKFRPLSSLLNRGRREAKTGKE